ncbi:MAG TPA: TIGR02588 family protein [Candidatus Obscuribacterales bacterium]
MSEVNNQDINSPEPEKPPRSLPELVTFGIATFILSAIVGLVVYSWLNHKDRPPVVYVTRKSEIRQVQGQYYVPFAVSNTGGETAESVQVIAELRVGGEVEETGEQQIDFLSSGETEEGAFVFSRNPGEGELILRVASYKLP